MTNKKKSFLLHIDSLDILDDLTNGQAGVLFKAIKAYQKNEDFDLDSIVKIAFSPFKNQFARDNIKYDNLCEKNRLIAIKRHATNSTSGTSGNQALPTVTKSTDNKNKTNSDSDKDSDNKVTKDYSYIDEGFEYWWSKYPSSRRRNKPACKLKFRSKCKSLDEKQVEEFVNKLCYDVSEKLKLVDDIKFMQTTEPYLNKEAYNDE